MRDGAPVNAQRFRRLCVRVPHDMHEIPRAYLLDGRLRDSLPTVWTFHLDLALYDSAGGAPDNMPGASLYAVVDTKTSGVALVILACTHFLNGH